MVMELCLLADDSGKDVTVEDEPGDSGSGQESPRPNPKQIIASRMSSKLGKGRGKQPKGRGKRCVNNTAN